MGKKILAIYGSPRKEGNTGMLLDSMVKGLEKNIYMENLHIDKIYAKDLNISSCAECRSCSKNGICILKDDMQAVFLKLIACDFLVIASPIFFTTVSGNIKPLIDRCQRFWALKYELKKDIIHKRRKGMFISTAGYHSDTIFDCAKKVVKSLFDVLYVDYVKDFLYNSVDHKGDILKKEGALESVYEYGKNLTLS
jgi:multimeric flavodoxin WrbA